MKYGLEEKTIQKIKSIFQNFPKVEEVILYGSRARGTHRPGSDVDLTLIGYQLDLQTLNPIRSALHDLNTAYTFDLSIFSNIENPDLIDHIERVGKVFHNNSFFKMSTKELADALRVLDSQSSNIEDYNLTYDYDADLNELPENSEDMSRYADYLIARSRIELEGFKTDRKWEELAGAIGMAGSLRKMTGNHREAEILLKYSISIVEHHHLSDTLRVQQSIRLFDVYKRTKNYQTSLQGLAALIEECKEHPKLANYLDFALQHLGKTQFSLGQYDLALQSFQQALKLRISKKDQSLIESSQSAIDACSEKLSSTHGK